MKSQWDRFAYCVFVSVKREPWDQPRLQTLALKAVKEGERLCVFVCVCVLGEFGLVAECDLSLMVPDCWRSRRFVKHSSEPWD